MGVDKLYEIFKQLKSNHVRELKFLFRDLRLDVFSSSYESNSDFIKCLKDRGIISSHNTSEIISRLEKIPDMAQLLKKVKSSVEVSDNTDLVAERTPKRRFTELLFGIGLEIDSTDKEDICLFLKLDKKASIDIFDVFEHLVLDGKISMYDTSFLRKMLQSCKRFHLDEMVESYEKKLLDMDFFARDVENFVGRSTNVSEITKLLRGLKSKVILINGLPGMGKTVLAKYIIHKLLQPRVGDDITCKLIDLRNDVDRPKPFVDFLWEVMTAVGYKMDVSLNMNMDFLMQRLKNINDPFVILIDNADDWLLGKSEVKKEFISFIENFLESNCSSIQLLITSRFCPTADDSEQLEQARKTRYFPFKLLKMDEDESKKLLRKYSQTEKGEEGRSVIPEEELVSIAKSSGHHPLTMKLRATSYLSQPADIPDVGISPHLCDILKQELQEARGDIVNCLYVFLNNLSYGDLTVMFQLAVFPAGFTAKDAKAVLCNFDDPAVSVCESNYEFLNNLCSLNLLESGTLSQIEKRVDAGDRFVMHLLLRSFCNQISRKKMWGLFKAFDNSDKKNKIEEIYEFAKSNFVKHFCSEMSSFCLISSKNYKSACRNFVFERSNYLHALSSGIRSLAKQKTQESTEDSRLRLTSSIIIDSCLYVDMHISTPKAAEDFFAGQLNNLRSILYKNETSQVELILLYFVNKHVVSDNPKSVEREIIGRMTFIAKESFGITISSHGVWQWCLTHADSENIEHRRHALLAALFVLALKSQVLLFELGDCSWDSSQTLADKASNLLDELMKLQGKGKQKTSRKNASRDHWIFPVFFCQVGDVYFRIGQLKKKKPRYMPKARNFYSKAVEFLESRKKNKGQVIEGCSTSNENGNTMEYIPCYHSVIYHQNIANCYQEEENYEEAIQNFEKANELCKKARLNNSLVETFINYSTGICYYRKASVNIWEPAFKSYDSAIRYMKNALKGYNKFFGLHARTASALGMLGVLFFNNTRREDHQKQCFEYMKKCLIIEERLYNSGLETSYTLKHTAETVSRCPRVFSQSGTVDASDWNKLNDGFCRLVELRDKAQEIATFPNIKFTYEDSDVDLVKEDEGLDDLFNWEDEISIKDSLKVMEKVVEMEKDEVPDCSTMRIIGAYLLEALKNHSERCQKPSVACFGSGCPVYSSLSSCCNIHCLNALNEFPSLPFERKVKVKNDLVEDFKHLKKCRNSNFRAEYLQNSVGHTVNIS